MTTLTAQPLRDLPEGGAQYAAAFGLDSDDAEAVALAEKIGRPPTAVELRRMDAAAARIRADQQVPWRHAWTAAIARRAWMDAAALDAHRDQQHARRAAAREQTTGEPSEWLARYLARHAPPPTTSNDGSGDGPRDLVADLTAAARDAARA